MVSGGAYGTEEIVRGGYGIAVLVLLVTPLLWSLPTALMIGELSAAMPREGGYYAWVRRALGPCWGFQEAWLSLAASVFDMAIYPTLFVAYLVRLFPGLPRGIAGRGRPGGGGAVRVAEPGRRRLVAESSLWLFVLLSAPFAVLVGWRRSSTARWPGGRPGDGGLWDHGGWPWRCGTTWAGTMPRP